MGMPEFLDSSTKPGFRKPLSSVSTTFSPFNHIHGDTKGKKTRGFQRHNKPVWQNVPAASLKDMPVCGFFRSLGRVWMLLEAKEAWRAPESPSSWHWKGTEAIYLAQRRRGRASSRGLAVLSILLFLPFSEYMSWASPHQSSPKHNPTDMSVACFHIFLCIPTCKGSPTVPFSWFLCVPSPNTILCETHSFWTNTLWHLIEEGCPGLFQYYWHWVGCGDLQILLTVFLMLKWFVRKYFFWGNRRETANIT